MRVSLQRSAKRLYNVIRGKNGNGEDTKGAFILNCKNKKIIQRRVFVYFPRMHLSTVEELRGERRT